MTGAEAEAAARVLERLLSDPAYREEFRRRPVAMSRQAGLGAVAEEMAMAPGNLLDTLDGRESRSSLAGVLMAAALEGAGVIDLASGLVPHHRGLPAPVEQVLSRPRPGPADGAHVAAGVGEGAAPGAPPPAAVAGQFRAVTPEEAAAAATARASAAGPMPEPLALPSDAHGGGSAGAVAEPPALPANPASPVSADDVSNAADGSALDEEDSGDAAAAADSDDGSADDSISDDPSDEDDDEDDEDDGDDGSDDASGGENPDDGSSGDDGDDGSDGVDGGNGSDDGDDGSDSGGDDSDSGGDDSDNGDDDSDNGGGSDSDSGDAPPDPGDGPTTYPGDGASRAEIARWMASAARARGLPPELPVMAALTESGLSNLDRGDRDSVGFFQMRTSIWNRGEYAGYPDKADLQLKWFLDHAAAVKQQRIAAGLPVDDPKSYGEWIADVERPAAQYRERYQLHLDAAREVLRHAGERAPHHREPPAGADVADSVDAPSARAGPRALLALAEARRYIGTRYQWGGSTPKTGFDCSGLVQWAYAKAGIGLPRTSEQQILAPGGTPVSRANLRPGDLVFFRDPSGDVHHVGISLGGDRFVAAPHTGARVRIDSLDEPYYAQQFTGGRRFDAVPAGHVAHAAPDAAGDGHDERSRIDAGAVRRAREALLRDAAEAQRPGTALFEAVRAQELRKQHYDAMFLPVVDPNAVR